MLINPRIVFTFTRQRWSSTTFSTYLALLVYCTSSTYFCHLATSLFYVLVKKGNESFFKQKSKQRKF
jgi:hypothetical protein